MFKRILVPVDGSRTSGFGIDEAVRLAKEQHARLCLLHVVDESVLTQNVEVGVTIVDDLLNAMREAGREVLARAQAKVRRQRVASDSVLVEKMVRSVADVIIEQAKKWRADVIVMGTHGRRGITRMVMGSAAEGVVRDSPVPVLLVRTAPRRKR